MSVLTFASWLVVAVDWPADSPLQPSPPDRDIKVGLDTHLNIPLVPVVKATGYVNDASTGDGIAVKESDVPTPTRGMTMDQVAGKFGAPTDKTPAVGKPPISRWQYPGFIVYFEGDHVIHSVIANS